MASEDDCQAKSPLADISRAKELLDYKPEVGFEEGLVKTVKYFVEKLEYGVPSAGRN